MRHWNSCSLALSHIILFTLYVWLFCLYGYFPALSCRHLKHQKFSLLMICFYQITYIKRLVILPYTVKQFTWHDKVINDTTACFWYIGKTFIKSTLHQPVQNHALIHIKQVDELVSKRVHLDVVWPSGKGFCVRVFITTHIIKVFRIPRSILGSCSCIEVSTQKSSILSHMSKTLFSSSESSTP